MMHDPEVIFLDALCHRLAIVDYGKVIALGTPDELKRSVPGGYVVPLQFENGSPSFLESLKSLEGVTEVRPKDGSGADVYADH